MNMTYGQTGVNYDLMDPFKKKAQVIGLATAKNILRLNGGEFREFEASRGESAYLIETPDSFLAHVEEGLGTKNLVADAVHKLTGLSYYGNVAQDTVAMIVNDMITLGALPLSVAMHLAVGDSNWFKDERRSDDLIDGWARACRLARCAWGGGETPTLKGVVIPETVVLSGSSMGIVKPKGRLIQPGKIRHGDVILIAESSGIHANGLTLCRTIADKLPEGYLTKLSDNTNYGEALLKPTHIYVDLVEDCLNNGVDIHYAVNITGHGWRKFMRANGSFAYVIDQLPRQLPIFDFIQKYGPVDDREAYGNLNMGAGFAIYVPESDIDKVWEVLEQNTSLRYRVYRAGYIEQSSSKKVIIRQKGLEYAGETLAVR